MKCRATKDSARCRAWREGWKPLAVVTMLCAGLGACVALGLRFVDCANERFSVCSTPGLVQLLIALGGLVPALGTLVQSFRGRGHPGRWFWLTAVTYSVWALDVWRGPEFTDQPVRGRLRTRRPPRGL